MGKYEKILRRIMSDPYITDMTIDEVKRILDKNGFRLQSVRGSHHVFVHKDLEYPICIPTVNGRTVKPGYIRAIRSALLEIEH